MRVVAIPVGHVVSEFASINVALSVPESALALGLVVRPLPLVVRTICPILDAITVTNNRRCLTVTLDRLIVCHMLIASRTLNILDTITLRTQTVLQSPTFKAIRTTRRVPTTLHPNSHGLVHLFHLPAIHRVVGVYELVHVL